MRIASLDIGTNTILLLIADVEDNRIVRVVHEGHEIARLGEGVHASRIISPAAFNRALRILSAYKEAIDTHNVDVTITAGTSALRDAANSREFCAFIQERLALSIDIISGDDEARWTYLGALSGFPEPRQQYAVIDIGGGSTEIIGGDARHIIQKESIDVGAVRMTELFALDASPPQRRIEEASSWLRTQLSAARIADLAHAFAIGVAGTATTLAAVDLNLQTFDAARIAGVVLSRQAVDTIVDRFKSMTVGEIASLPQVHAGRADVILGGGLILSEFLHAGGFDSIAVSDRGLRYGLALQQSTRAI